MEIANAQLSQRELDALVSKMFAQVGADRRLSLSFDDFSDVMSDKLDMLWDVCLDFKGIWYCTYLKVCFVQYLGKFVCVRMLCMSVTGLMYFCMFQEPRCACQNRKS